MNVEPKGQPEREVGMGHRSSLELRELVKDRGRDPDASAGAPTGHLPKDIDALVERKEERIGVQEDERGPPPFRDV